MGDKNQGSFVGYGGGPLGHPCRGSFLTGPDDVTAGGVGADDTVSHSVRVIPTRTQSGGYRITYGGTDANLDIS